MYIRVHTYSVDKEGVKTNTLPRKLYPGDEMRLCREPLSSYKQLLFRI